jgi:hypothetical protein
VTTAPLLLGFSPFWSLVISAIVAALLLNSLDAETLRAQQAEQKKLLDQQRAERAKQQKR